MNLRSATLKVLLFLIAGAIINVAVAWGCAIYSPINHFDSLDRMSAFVEVPTDLNSRLRKSMAVGFGREDVFFNDAQVAGGTLVVSGFVNRKSVGWPSLCLVGNCDRVPVFVGDARDVISQAVSSSHTTTRTLRTAFWSPEWLIHNDKFSLPRTSVVDPEDFFPVQPLWRGFLINTIFYAAIVWFLFFAPGAVRRRVRRKRGQCAACGYSMRGAVSEKCPECGGEQYREALDRIGSMKALNIGFWIITLLMIGAVGLGWFYRSLAGVALYDSNFEAFHNALSQEQGNAIIHASQNQLTLSLLLFSVLSLIWFGFGLAAIGKINGLKGRFHK
jgi:hypothetical protein